MGGRQGRWEVAGDVFARKGVRAAGENATVSLYRVNVYLPRNVFGTFMRMSESRRGITSDAGRLIYKIGNGIQKIGSLHPLPLTHLPSLFSAPAPPPSSGTGIPSWRHRSPSGDPDMYLRFKSEAFA